MSISYTIVFGSNDNVEKLGRSFEYLGFTFDPQNAGRHPKVSLRTYEYQGLLASLMAVDDMSKEIYREGLSIETDFKVVIEVPDSLSYKDDDSRKMLELVEKLTLESKDLSFLFNGEKTLLLKRSGIIAIDQGAQFWTEENVQLISVLGGIERESLPVI